MATLGGRVVVVTDVDAARAVVDAGGAVVLVSRAPDSGGAIADLEADEHRVAHFTGDLTNADDRAALAEMIAELHPPPASVEPA